MSLYVYNRPITKEELQKNYNTLHDKVHNYVTVRQMYSPPSTVGYTNVNANEVVYKAGLNQAKILEMERRRSWKMIEALKGKGNREI